MELNLPVGWLSRPRTTGIALILGGLGFMLFWGNEIGDLVEAWVPSLLIHGVTIVSLSVGIIGLHRTKPTTGWEHQLELVATVGVVVGLLTVIELFFVACIFLGSLHLRLGTWMAIASALLIVGAGVLLSLLIAYGLGHEGGREVEGLPAGFALFGIAALGMGWVLIGQSLVRASLVH
jgi:hypothetical protein